MFSVVHLSVGKFNGKKDSFLSVWVCESVFESVLVYFSINWSDLPDAKNQRGHGKSYGELGEEYGINAKGDGGTE